MDECWDDYCSRAAGERMLKTAATLWSIGGTKGSEAVRHSTDRTACALMKATRAGWATEEAFLRTLIDTLDMASDDAEMTVEEVRTRAMTLRGQLELFKEAT